MFHRFQNTISTNKEETVNSQNALIASIKEKYKAENAELVEHHNVELFNKQEEMRKLNNELKVMQEKVQTEKDLRQKTQETLDKRNQDHEEQRKNLFEQIEN